MEGKEGARVDFPPRFFRIRKEDRTRKSRYIIPGPPGYLVLPPVLVTIWLGVILSIK